MCSNEYLSRPGLDVLGPMPHWFDCCHDAEVQPPKPQQNSEMSSDNKNVTAEDKALVAAAAAESGGGGVSLGKVRGGRVSNAGPVGVAPKELPPRSGQMHLD